MSNTRPPVRFILTFILTVLAFSRVEVAHADERQEILAPETSDSSRRTQISIYSETYPFFFPAPTIEYQRLRAEIFPLNIPVHGFNLTPFVDLINEKYSFSQTNLSLEAGLTHTFDPQTRLLISVRRTNFNNDENNPWQFRLGYAAGRIKEWRTRVFLEGYSEGFLINPNHLQGVVSFEAWAKFGYRAYERHHFVIDPLILEARTYQDTIHAIGGRDYLTLTLGPRLTVWFAEHNFSASLFFGRQHDWSTAPIEANQWWGIFALGAYF